MESETGNMYGRMDGWYTVCVLWIRTFLVDGRERTTNVCAEAHARLSADSGQPNGDGPNGISNGCVAFHSTWEG